MKSPHFFRAATIVVAMSSSFVSFASAEASRNGQTFYGQPASQSAVARVVDVGATKHVNVTYGETVVFQAPDGKKFSWTFNGLDSRSWDLAEFSPSGFAGKDYRVYVGENPLYRR